MVNFARGIGSQARTDELARRVWGGNGDESNTGVRIWSTSERFLSVEERCSISKTSLRNKFSLDINLASRCNTDGDSGVTSNDTLAWVENPEVPVECRLSADRWGVREWLKPSAVSHKHPDDGSSPSTLLFSRRNQAQDRVRSRTYWLPKSNKKKMKKNIANTSRFKRTTKSKNWRIASMNPQKLENI